MKINVLYTLALMAVGAAAQTVSIIAPAPNTQITAGQQFTATVAFADTTSSVDVLALFFGAKANDPEVDDLGQTRLAVTIAPTFASRGPDGQMVQNVDLTFPTDLINGLNRTYNLTCGEFYTLGAENTPFTHTAQVPVFVSSG